MDCLAPVPKLVISTAPHQHTVLLTFQHGAKFKIIDPFYHLLFPGNPIYWSDSSAKQKFKVVKEVALGKDLVVLTNDQWRLSAIGGHQTPAQNVGNSGNMERGWHAEEACFLREGDQCFSHPKDHPKVGL